MTGSGEAERRLRDARDSLSRAERCYRENDWRGTVQNAQTAIELSTKAVISLFEEPQWTHNPSEQLEMIVRQYAAEFEKSFNEQILAELTRMSEHAKLAAPWHGWAVYGREIDETWTAAVDLCTQDVAEQLLAGAREAVSVANKITPLRGERSVRGV